MSVVMVGANECRTLSLYRIYVSAWRLTEDMLLAYTKQDVYQYFLRFALSSVFDL